MEGYMAGRLWTRDTMVSLLRGLAETTRETADLNLMEALRKILEISLILGLAMMLGELSLTPISEDVRRATDLLKRGALSKRFWGLGVGLGIFVPVILLLQTKCY